MTTIDYDSFFEGETNKFYDARYIVTVLEEILGDNIENVKREVAGLQVEVSEEQITEFLDQKFEEEEPELKKKMKNRENMDEAMEESDDPSQEFFDQLSVARYSFNPYTLEYFKRYSGIVRDKALVLLNIIDGIGSKDTASIQELITDLDIELDENGNISRDDIIRLMSPTVYNIEALREKVGKANDLSTYLTFRVSKLMGGRTEDELYPTTSLQIKDLHCDPIHGNVALSKKQREELAKKHNDITENVEKLLLGL